MTRTLATPVARRALGIGAALAAGLVLPIVVHLIPVDAGPPMGARLLPIFLAATIAAMRMDAVSALSIAVLTPLLNRLLTGSPAGAMLPTLLIELAVVVTILLLVRRLAPGLLRLSAAPAYLFAAVIAGALVAGDGAGTTLGFALRHSWPGLLLLAVVGAASAPTGRDARRT